MPSVFGPVTSSWPALPRRLCPLKDPSSQRVSQGWGTYRCEGQDVADGSSTARVVPGKATPRGRFPHVKVAGGLAFISGTSARRADNSIEGAEVDGMGTTNLDIRVQTHAVIENLRDILRDVGADLSDLVS